MKKIIITLFFLVPVLTSLAQTKCNIKKAYAFYTISVPGVQMADENGNPIPPKADITRFIYIEWIGTTKPKIETVLYNNKALAAKLIAAQGRTVVPGSELSPNNVSKITVKKGNSLWKVELQPVSGNPMPEPDCKNIIVKNKGTGKACLFKLIKETQLMMMPRY